jgi:hypothetical protein
MEDFQPRKDRGGASMSRQIQESGFSSRRKRGNEGKRQWNGQGEARSYYVCSSMILRIIWPVIQLGMVAIAFVLPVVLVCYVKRPRQWGVRAATAIRLLVCADGVCARDLFSRWKCPR